VRSHAKAATAGPTQRQAKGLGRFVRGAFATRGLSIRTNGSGARSHHRAAMAFAPLFATLAVVAFAPSANAAQLVEFGSFGGQAGGAAGQIRDGEGVAVNRAGAGGVEPGDVYVADSGNHRVEEFSKGGQFVRTWGKDVDATEPGTGFEICTAASGHTCKAGTSSREAGAFELDRGIAIDQDTGNVFVAESGGLNRRINVFSAEGQFEGAFGWEVNATAPAPELQFCTMASGCQGGQESSSAGGFNQIYSGALGVDPSSGDLWVGDVGNNRINEFSFTLNGAEEVTGVSFVRALGWDVNASAPAEELQECTVLTGCQAGTRGGGAGQFDFINGIALDAAGDIYVTSGSGCSTTSPCRVLKFNPDGTFKEVFGPSSGGESKCQLTWTSGSTGTNAASAIVVDPTDQHVFVTRKVTGTSFEVCEFDPEGTLVQRSPAEPVPTSSEAGGGSGIPSLTLALAEEGRAYVLAPTGTNTSWPVRIYGLVPAAPVELLPATEVAATSATLNGEVTVPAPGGTGFDVAYRFEYSADNGLTWLRAPSAGNASVGTTVPGTYPVHQKIEGLLPKTTYRVRLVSFTSFTTTSEERSLTTPVSVPRFSEIRASFADQSSATLEAKINPSGGATTYRFEWGPTTAYGNDVPADFEPFVGSGNEPALVTAKLTGLSAGTTYHYRIVARNSAGTAASPDQILETLNSCGLSEGRCFELVSPQDPGPVGIPGQNAAAVGVHFQATPEPGSLAYIIENGLSDATTGADVLYRGTRAPGWSSTQLNAPFTDRSETTSANSFSSVIYGLSADLSCGVVVSGQPLSDDASTEVVREAGGSNLYRRNPDGSYTAISKLAPENLDAISGFIVNEYSLVAMSDDCSKVIFVSAYRYPGVPSVSSPGGIRLYEWDDGTLRSLSYVPGPSGETLVVPTTGSGGGVGFEATINLVSADGSRVFFGAERQTSPNSEEIGKNGIFVREDGTSTRDLSLSETSTPDEGATYQWATKDGSRVFFTANAGLTGESSSEGTDLYEYDLESDTLTDLSVDHETGGAQVADFIGGSDDGSHVYFIAQGQLIPGKGKTLAQNKSDDTYSIYGAEGGIVSYVATIGEADLRPAHVKEPQYRTSRVSPDGRYLLFESRANVTGYESGGSREAYLYDDAASSSEATVCVSCRQDGRESVEPIQNFLLARGGESNPLYAPRSLVVRDGRPHVFFNSFDKLAAGGVEGAGSVYEWSHGQLFRIATEPPGINGPEENDILAQNVNFLDADADGTDLYFATPTSLNWEDRDGRVSVYDARIDGGFPEPPAPPAPCEPKSEGSCEGATAPPPASTPTPSSSTFNGPGNVKPKAQHKKRHKRHHRKRKARHAKHQRHANANRRAGK